MLLVGCNAALGVAIFLYVGINLQASETWRAGFIGFNRDAETAKLDERPQAIGACMVGTKHS